MSAVILIGLRWTFYIERDKVKFVEVRMLDSKGFDLWANGYDKSVGLSDEENTYPFAGYKRILGIIYKTIIEKQNPIVLDIGFGTGTLTRK